MTGVLFGFVQSFHSVSTFTLSVLIDSFRQPLLFARMARTSDMGLSLSTTVLNFCSGGNRTCNYIPITVTISRRGKKEVKRTSGSGHRGSLSLSTSAGRITSIFTSCATRTFLPTRVRPLISNDSTACPLFFASFMMTSSVSEAVEADDDEADLRAARRASEGKAMVMTFAALDWIRYPVKSASTLICLCRDVKVPFINKKTNTYDQTWIPPSFASLLHIMCKFVSVNLMMHFFCSFSMAWMISGG